MSKLSIVVSSDQGTIFAYDLIISQDETQLIKCYTLKDHAAKLKDINLTKSLELITASEDELVQIYNHSKKKQTGTLLGQQSFTNKIQSSKDYIILG